MTRWWVMAIWSYSHSGRRTGTRYRRKWFYILSNAVMQCIGQTIMRGSSWTKWMLPHWFTHLTNLRCVPFAILFGFEKRM